jgi:putative endonuclease
VEQLVARWAHNPKVTGSSPVPATKKMAVRTNRFFMRFTVYVLHSAKFDKIYVGYTSDVESRLRSHNELATKGWTIKFRPWELVYTEAFDLKNDALKREKELKSYQGRMFIRNTALKR